MTAEDRLPPYVLGHYPMLVWFGELIGDLIWRMRR